MGNRNIVFAKDGFYHLYNRGVDKRKVFISDYERNRFLSLLYLCNSTSHVDMNDLLKRKIDFSEMFSFDRGDTLVDVGAYCLMPNHFHILVKEKDSGVAKFMQKLTTAYTMFFNKRHNRSGALFQGVFQAEHVNSDRYLKYLFSYIHLNPIGVIDDGWKKHDLKSKKDAREFIDNYEFSSFLDYKAVDKSSRAQGVVLNDEAFPSYFESRTDFDSHVDDFISLASKS